MTNDRGMTDLVVLDDLCDFTEFYDSRANIEFRGSMDSDLGDRWTPEARGLGALLGVF